MINIDNDHSSDIDNDHPLSIAMLRVIVLLGLLCAMVAVLLCGGTEMISHVVQPGLMKYELWRCWMLLRTMHT